MAKKDVKETAKKAVAEVKEAPKAAKKVAEKTAKKVEKDVKNVEKEVKKVEKEVKDTAKKTAKQAKSTAKKAADKALLCTCVKGLFFEYGDKQVDAASLSELVKKAYKDNGGKAVVRSMELYVKAEDNAVYYVINGKESGKVEL